MALWTYSPAGVEVLMAGIFRLEGFADGTFIKIQKSSPIYTTRKSADGVVSRSYQKDHLYKIDITLAQSAPSNSVLMKMVEIDEATQMGIFPIYIKDNSGNTFFYSSNVWITSLPEVSYSNGLEVRTWELVAADGVMSIGDNAGDDSLVTDLVNQVTALAPYVGGLFK